MINVQVCTFYRNFSARSTDDHIKLFLTLKHRSILTSHICQHTPLSSRSGWGNYFSECFPANCYQNVIFFLIV